MKHESKNKIIKNKIIKKIQDYPIDTNLNFKIEELVKKIESSKFKFLEFNRPIDYDWVDQIVDKQVLIYKKINKWYFPDIFLLIKLPNEDSYGFFDSQHRIKAIEKLYSIYPEEFKNYEITIKIYDDYENLNLLFEIANTRLNVNSSILMTINSIDDEELLKDIEMNSKVNLLIQKLEKKYGKIFIPGTGINLCHPFLLKQSFILEFKKNYNSVTEIDAVFEKICEENEKVKTYMISDDSKIVLKRINKINAFFQTEDKFYMSYYNFYLSHITGKTSNMSNCKWLKYILC